MLKNKTYLVLLFFSIILIIIFSIMKPLKLIYNYKSNRMYDLRKIDEKYRLSLMQNYVDNNFLKKEILILGDSQSYGFLYPNKVLQAKNIMHKKGFPESYDIRKLVQFVSDVKAGERHVVAPVYSHVTYDITDEQKVVDCPDVLIIEGLNVLQSGMDYPHAPHTVFISDFLDFSIYVDADTRLIEEWYVDRFMSFRFSAFTKPGSYFSHYTQLSEEAAVEKAQTIWHTINGKNLQQNILPTKFRAQLILRKGDNHTVEEILLRK